MPDGLPPDRLAPDRHAIVVARSLWEQMVSHVQAEAPREAVGILGGTVAGEIERICPLPNVAGPFAFFADPFAQFQAEKSLRAADLKTVGYYHSHPGGGLDLSDHDRLFARRVDWVYLVLTTGPRGEQPVRGAGFRFVDGVLRKVSLIVRPGLR